MKETIEFVYPTGTKPISLTGEYCALGCKHCNKIYLRHMQTPYNFREGNESSFLISGGCDSQGKVPVTKNLLFLHNLKNLGYKINMHTGLIEKEELETIAPLVDVVSFDLIGDERTISEVYNLDKTVWDFIQCYKNLKERIRTVPHITIGLHKGEIAGEYIAMKILEHFGAPHIVFNVLIPTKGTEFEAIQPPELVDVEKIFKKARLMFPKTPLSLGCMVPHGDYREELHRLAIDYSFDKIVNPTVEAKNYAVEKGVLLKESRECCVL